MRPKCCGLGNLGRLRPVRVILQTKGKLHDRDSGIYICGKGFPQATASLATCYNAVEGSYPPKSNNKVRKLDWRSIDVRRSSIGVQPSNNVRTSNGGQPWPGRWQLVCRFSTVVKHLCFLHVYLYIILNHERLFNLQFRGLRFFSEK